MSQSKLSILHGFRSLSLRLKKAAALQFFRHPPVRSVSLEIFSHLPLLKGAMGELLKLFNLQGWRGKQRRVYRYDLWCFQNS